MSNTPDPQNDQRPNFLNVPPVIRALFNHILRLTVGIILTPILATLFVENIETAIGLMAVSIVCTAGIGLFVWIPIIYMVGWIAIAITQFIVSLFFSRREESAPIANPITTLPSTLAQAPETANRIAIEDYVRRAVTLGHDYRRIVEALLPHGWTEQEIQTAYTTITEG